MQNKIEIAHESPISLMDTVRQHTDYDYAVSTMSDKEEYWNYFENSIKLGRKVILDNGVFEDGVSQEMEVYAQKIEKLKPTEYIVPDVWNDGPATMQSFLSWKQKYGSKLPGKTIGVVQGRTLKEFIECYRFMVWFADKIAINFASDCYNEAIDGDFGTKCQKMVAGRQYTLMHLVAHDLIARNIPHHLLGCYLPSDFGFYTKSQLFSFIESLDTSSPVVYGLRKGLYPTNLADIKEKDTTKIKELIDIDVERTTKSFIISNINTFKKYVNGI